jgi:hypothetical protein
VPAWDYRAVRSQVRELHRLLGKKTLEAEILKEGLEHATGCGCRRRYRRTILNQGGGRGDWGLPLQSDRTVAGPAEEATWSAITTGRPARGRDQGGQLPNCRPAATGGSTPFSSGRRQQFA